MSLMGKARASLARRSPDPLARPVLVVEDDAGVRAFLVAVLEHHGYRVIAASSGEEALQLVGNQAVQLAVLDIGLPGMDGFAVADQLDGVPVIIVTGDPVGAYAKAHGRAINYQVLPKPVSPGLLEHAVTAVV